MAKIKSFSLLRAIPCIVSYTHTKKTGGREGEFMIGGGDISGLAFCDTIIQMPESESN